MAKSVNKKMQMAQERPDERAKKNEKRYKNRRRGEPGTARLKREMAERNQEPVPEEYKAPEPEGLISKIKGLFGR